MPVNTLLAQSPTPHACESRNKLASPIARPRRSLHLGLLIIGGLLVALAADLGARQPEHAPPPAQGTGVEPGAVAEGETTEAEHEPGLWSLVARLVNFAILVGVLYYLLRSPLATYLASRRDQVRKDLVEAAEMRKAAAEQLAEIDRKLAALPGEVETLRARGAQEIAAEEARILQAAAAERERLLEQTRREIELQLRVARRELLKEAADLAVGVASERIKTHITDADQLRLVDRYLDQVSAPRRRT